MSDLSRFHLFTHAGCMDGSATAVLFLHAGGKRENIHYSKAGHVEEAWEDSGLATKTDPVLVVDLSPSTHELADFFASRHATYVLDHHKTAERFHLLPGFTISVGNEACGCELFRRWLVNMDIVSVNEKKTKMGKETLSLAGTHERFDADCYRRFIGIIDDHDRWILKIPFSLKLPVFFSFVGQKDFVERFMNVFGRFHEERESYWTPFEQDLLNIIQKRQDSHFRKLLTKFRIRERQFQGRTIKVGYLVDGVINNSELLHLYLDQHPEVDVACQINLDLDKVSFRSRKDGVDVSALATEFGGGGSYCASGHSIDPGVIDAVIGATHG